MTRRISAMFLALALAAPSLAAQPRPSRPVPHPIEPPAAFEQAIQRGTRAANGLPGPRYWQQWADYHIRATVDARARTLTGSETITYRNNSPDSHATLLLKVYQNQHAPGAMRNEEAEVTGGTTISRVSVDGAVLPRDRYFTQGTMLHVRLPQSLLPGGSVRLEIDFGFKLPQAGAGGRMGYSRDNLLYLAYWYPQMAVYDDVEGWHTDPFLGAAEFYMGYGSYQVELTAPEGWVVMGTGTLQNPAEVLTPTVLDRWRRAQGSDAVVHVLTPSDFGVGKATVDAPNDVLTWRFRADSVRDVAFSVTRESNWDAARTPVGDRDGDGRPDFTTINTFWRADAPLWAEAARYAQQSITHHSRFTGIPYPYPHMTAVEGEDIVGGGMEYPMMTLIGAYTQAGDTALYSVTAHELAHMWFPMIVGIDETRYGWMDEGTTDFNENEAFADFFPGAPSAHVREQQAYVGMKVNRGIDAELLTWTDFLHPDLGQFASYTKPATVLYALRGLLGEPTFLRGYRAYAAAWRYRHPKPWDFFHAFDAAAGRDLWWFWSTWYDETWVLDHAVPRVVDGATGTTITVEDRGNAPMPARLLITRQDGGTERREVPVDTWLSGARSVTVTVPAGPSPVVKVEIDPESFFPDIDRANNVWTR